MKTDARDSFLQNKNLDSGGYNERETVGPTIVPTVKTQHIATGPAGGCSGSTNIYRFTQQILLVTVHADTN